MLEYNFYLYQKKKITMHKKKKIYNMIVKHKIWWLWYLLIINKYLL